MFATSDQRLRAASAHQTQPTGLHRLVHPAGGRGPEIQVYGDGSQLRDLVYVDDVVDAFLRAGASDACNGEVFNVGGNGPISLRDLVELLFEVAGTGRVRYVDWPDDRKSIDIGGFYLDSTKFNRAVGWTGQVDLRDGLTRTVGFYREHLDHYIDAGRDAS